MRSRAIVSLMFGIFVSSACLWYALKDVNLSAMFSGMGQVQVVWIMASVALGLLSLVVRAVRWGVLLRALTAVPAGSLLSATFIGMMANNLLPARLGEVVRAWVLARRERISTSTALGSIVIERLLDVLAALAILGLCLAVLPELGGGAAGLLKRAGLVILLIVVTGVAALFVALRFRGRLLRTAERWCEALGWGWISYGLELFRRFSEGLCVFRNGRQIVLAALLSVVIWAVAIGSFHVLAEGFGLGLTAAQTALVFVIVLFGIAMPSAPGFVGTFHGFCVAGLALVAGTDPTQAAAYATLLHGSQWMAINLVGLGFLLADRSLTWAAVLRRTKQEVAS